MFQGLGILTLPLLLNIHPKNVMEISKISLSCYSKHGILCTAQDISPHEYKLPAIYYEIFPPIDTPLCIFSQAQTRFEVINILFVLKVY